MTDRVSPADAWTKMQEGYTYVDVRTPAEFAGGRPKGAINIPLDDAFVTAMEDRFTKDAPIILGCATGRRSQRAANALFAAGFTNVLDQYAGFEGTRGPFGEVREPGWSREGLPTD